VQQATEQGDPGPIVVAGFFFNDGSTARLCDLIAESFPQQCGGASLVVVNPEDLVDVPLVEEGTSQWSDGFVVISATVAGDELTILSP
jgi:hypothetical protein